MRRRALQEFLRVCTHLVYADQLDLASVQRFDEELQRRMRASSRRIKIAAVRALACYLEEEAALSTPVTPAIALPRQERTEPARPVDIDDAAARMYAVRQAHKHLHVAVMAVLLGAGIMASELTELTLADLRATIGVSFGYRPGTKRYERYQRHVEQPPVARSCNPSTDGDASWLRQQRGAQRLFGSAPMQSTSTTLSKHDWSATHLGHGWRNSQEIRSCGGHAVDTCSCPTQWIYSAPTRRKRSPP
jgi:hypothetical protein